MLSRLGTYVGGSAFYQIDIAFASPVEDVCAGVGEWNTIEVPSL